MSDTDTTDIPGTDPFNQFLTPWNYYIDQYDYPLTRFYGEVDASYFAADRSLYVWSSDNVNASVVLYLPDQGQQYQLGINCCNGNQGVNYSLWDAGSDPSEGGGLGPTARCIYTYDPVAFTFHFPTPAIQVLLAADPTAALGAATKQYVDAHAASAEDLETLQTMRETVAALEQRIATLEKRNGGNGDGDHKGNHTGGHNAPRRK
jgi:hypothetical protein